MIWRRKRSTDVDRAAEQVAESQRRTAEEQAIARQAQEADAVADRLRSMNASNGFAEALVRAVVRGSS